MILHLIIRTLFFVGQGLCNINVALNKDVSDCIGNTYPELVDGNLNTTDIINKTCDKTLTFNVDIGGPYYIHYVILVADDCEETHEIAFLVQSPDGNICGRYYEQFANCSTHRVNCIDISNASSTIIVRYKSKPIKFREIEIYTIASGNPNENIIIYHGCYKNFLTMINHGQSNKMDCRRLCSVKGFLFAALEYKNLNCHCGYYVSESFRAIKTLCLKGCHPDDKDCTEKDKFYSVYIIRVRLPHRYSCIEYYPSTENESPTETSSIEECMKQCDASQFSMVEYSTNDSIACSCNNGTFDKSQHDHFRRCGKTERNSLIYANCFDGYVRKTKCSKLLMQCKDGWDMYGTCKGGCKRGFTGEQCLRRIPTACDMDPCPKGISKCEETYNGDDDVDGKNDFNCVCHKGYVKLENICINGSLYCNFNSCHKESSSCMRTSIGTYKCICKPGFVYKTDSVCVRGDLCSVKNVCRALHTKCIVSGLRFQCICEEGYGRDKSRSDCYDIDECVYEPCNPGRSTCQNYDGTYECKCKEGYSMISSDTCAVNTTHTSEQQLDSGLLHPAIFLMLIPLMTVVVFLGMKMYTICSLDG